MPDSPFDAKVAPARARATGGLRRGAGRPRRPGGGVDLGILEEKSGLPVAAVSARSSAEPVARLDEATRYNFDRGAGGLCQRRPGVGGSRRPPAVRVSWCASRRPGSEPLVLWQAMVGEPSSGKSSALAPMRRLLGAIEEERRALDDERRERHAESFEPRRSARAEAFVPSRIAVADAAVETIAEVVSGNPRGLIQWRDEPSAWLGQLGDADNDGGDRAHWLAGWATGAVRDRAWRASNAEAHLEKVSVKHHQFDRPDSLKEAFTRG